MFKSLDTKIFFDEAKKLGLKVRSIFPKNSVYSNQNFFEITYKKHKEYIIGQTSSKLSLVSSRLSENKYFANLFLKRAGISVPMCHAFDINEIKGVKKIIKQIKFPVVIKQMAGTHGDLVFVKLNTYKEVFDSIELIKKSGKNKFLIEKYFEGKEYRLLATPKKFLAATHRIPANVVGDGKRTIEKLIRIKNQDPNRGSHADSALIDIEIDAKMKKYLKEQKLTVKSVPKKDQQVFLRKTSNLSSGGDSIDYTAKIHPSVKKIAIKAIKTIGLPHGAVDFISTDITKPQTKRTYRIIETNYSPMTSMHHFPYKGKSRNVTKEILLDLFSELKKKN